MHRRSLLLLLLLAPRPHTVLFEGQLTLKSTFTVFSVGLPGQSPPPKKNSQFHPPPHMHEPSKAGRPLCSEATHEININLTFDHMP